MLKHSITLPDGTTVDRRSASKTYSHAVVVRDLPDGSTWRVRNWCGREELAIRELNTVATHPKCSGRFEVRVVPVTTKAST